MKRISFYKR